MLQFHKHSASLSILNFVTHSRLGMRHEVVDLLEIIVHIKYIVLLLKTEAFSYLKSYINHLI